MVTERKNKIHLNLGVIPNNNCLENAHRLLCVLKDGFSLEELISILCENNINVTSAHVELLCNYTDLNNLVCEYGYDREDDRILVAEHIKRNLDIIPIDDNSLALNVYYKKTISKYLNTLTYLLKFKESWSVLIKNKNELKRIVEYYKQQGLWNQLLSISNDALNFCEPDVKIELLRTNAWIYFWTRDYDSLKILLEEHPEIENDAGVNNYTNKLRYITKEGLTELSKRLENKDVESDYFATSLLGRTYARLSTINKNDKESLLQKAESLIRLSLNLAIESKDLVEIAVQNWYLSLILIEEGKIDQAKKYLAETKRLDENIMERKPGIAWLRVAEYRLSLANRDDSTVTQKSKNRAYNAMHELGMKKIDEYLENDYFF